MVQQARREDDRDLVEEVRTALAPLDLAGLRVTLRNGTVHLEGAAPSVRQALEAETLARQVPGVGRVANELAVDPLASRATPREAELEPLTGADVGLQGLTEVTGTEPDLNRDIGTNNPLKAVDGREPYYPPTDPVVKPVPRRQGDIRIVGGFARGATSAPISPWNVPPRLREGDGEIADNVRLALAEDAATASLQLEVQVRRGVVTLFGQVGSLEDIDLAEEVAARVPGVVEVREALEIEGL